MFRNLVVVVVSLAISSQALLPEVSAADEKDEPGVSLLSGMTIESSGPATVRLLYRGEPPS